MNFWKPARSFVTVFSVITCLAVLSGPQVFASEPEGDESPGIPAYSVSRLKVLAGVVYSRTSDSDWQEATTNTPLGPDSRISVPKGSEAELQFHGGQFVLLTSGVDIEVPEMSEGATRFRLRAGEIRFDLPGDDFAPVSVRVPGGALARFDEPGRYWMAVTDEDATNLIVRRGRATVTQEGETTRILEGQQALIGRNITVTQHKSTDESVPEPAPLTTQEHEAGVPPVVGYELRDYGKWIYSSSYGYVWQPRVASGWSPYVYGRWDWISPYGWVWIAYEPWGWYPYRTGYWVSVSGIGWAWAPYRSFGSVYIVRGAGYYRSHGYRRQHQNVYYRPANVRFIQGASNIRWVPLRPGERYRPPQARRNDPQLTSWNRALESNRVYMAQGGPDQSRRWRDVREVQAERQAAATALSSTAAVSRVDTRAVRPELTRPMSATAAGSTRNPAAVNASRSAERTGDRSGVSSLSPSRDVSSTRERYGASSVSPSHDVSSTRERPGVSSVSPSRDVSSNRDRPGVSSLSPSRDASEWWSGASSMSNSRDFHSTRGGQTVSPSPYVSQTPSRSTTSPSPYAPQTPSRSTTSPSPYVSQTPSRSTTSSSPYVSQTPSRSSSSPSPSVSRSPSRSSSSPSPSVSRSPSRSSGGGVSRPSGGGASRSSGGGGMSRGRR